ncbi:hypothetical protein GCM10009840_03240 [Pseudolysinimonas kribbensis]|uniref:Transmembrane protein n=1 Tax=Pseudolysinimonas kribbensis TaxID=433641 RepID=A0ABQ6K4Y0_9MICO|nr:hypothetical protein [Pseudolysinimonas kribbensis]GMA94625.1 hypothetical protein GCM10025881_14490 [Pseudolysinimonas kribbensis]
MSAAPRELSAGAFWAIRLTLYGIGVALLVTGAVLLFGRPTGPRLTGIVLWLGCAIVLHDAILVPTLTLVGRVRDAAGRRIGIPSAAVQLVSGALAIGALLTLAVIPELWAQHLGPANPTVLPGDYGPRLLLVWGLLAVLCAAGIVLITLRVRRRSFAAR